MTFSKSNGVGNMTQASMKMSSFPVSAALQPILEEYDDIQMCKPWVSPG